MEKQFNTFDMNKPINLLGSNKSSNYNYGSGSTVTYYYGTFYDTTTQTATTLNVGQPVLLNTTDLSNGISVVDNSKITFDCMGVFNLQFSLEFTSTNSSLQTAWVWLSKRGVTIPYTGTKLSIVGNGASAVAAWNFVFTAGIGDYFELMWSTNSNEVKMSTLTIPGGGSSQIPSVILTVVQL